MPASRPAEERFWEKVDQSGDCWLWTASVRGKGYGAFWDGERVVEAHRFSYGLVAPIPHGHDIDHRTTCPKRCVRPDHLRPATRKQNQENRAGAWKKSRSGVRGVMWNEKRQSWYVMVKHNGKSHYGGIFATVKEAEPVAIALRNRLFTHNDVDRSAV